MASYVDTGPFHAGLRERRLLLQYCSVAQRFQHPPRPVSVYTGRHSLEWREVRGTGVVHAISTLRNTAGGEPLRYASIELDEGVRILGRLLDAGPSSGRIGARVQLAWEELEAGAVYPAFRLIDNG